MHSILSKMINCCDGYLERVSHMLSVCDTLNFKITIRSVITSMNGSIQHIKSFYNFLSNYSCIKEWDITPAFFSEYKKQEYSYYKPNNEDLIGIYNLSKDTNLKFPISLNKIGPDGYCLKRYADV